MARGGYPGGMGGGNFNALMKQAQKMQRDMEKAQEELEVLEVEATAGGGAVKVVVTGKKEVKEIVDDAIDHAESGKLRKAFSVLMSTRFDEDDYVILHEKDFNI